MRKIDSHQHFWLYNPVNHAWINDDMRVIQRDFLPTDLQPILQENGIEGCVAVQVDQTEAGNDFLLDLAEKNSFIKGIVGWIDLQSDNIEERLQHYSSIKPMKGFRHILQGEPDEKFMLNEQFMRGIGCQTNSGFS
jgi:L-fuconolactonase